MCCRACRGQKNMSTRHCPRGWGASATINWVDDMLIEHPKRLSTNPCEPRRLNWPVDLQTRVASFCIQAPWPRRYPLPSPPQVLVFIPPKLQLANCLPSSINSRRRRAAGSLTGAAIPSLGDQMARMRRKADLPNKLCRFCRRPVCWRKKWARDWDSVKFCSDRCHIMARQAGRASLDSAT